MNSAPSLKMASLFCIITGIILFGFTFDRELLALIGPFLFLTGTALSFVVIRASHGNLKASVPVLLWTLAVLINRVSGSYEFYSEYDFIDPLNGFFLSALISLTAFCITIFYFFKRIKTN